MVKIFSQQLGYSLPEIASIGIGSAISNHVSNESGM